MKEEEIFLLSEELEKKYFKDYISNQNVFKRVYWYNLCSYNGYCSHCPPNGGENAKSNRDFKNWKKYRRNQYKEN